MTVRLVSFIRTTLVGLSATLIVATAYTLSLKGPFESHDEDDEIVLVQPSSLQPYTVTLVEKLQMPGGQSRIGTTQVYALRSDGSFVESTDTLNPAWKGQRIAGRRIVSSRGVLMDVDDLREVKYTAAISPVQMARMLRNPASQCVRTLTGRPFAKSERLGSPEIRAGVRAVPITITDGTTMWYAVDLSCARLGRERVYDDGEVSVLEPTEIRSGEPEPELFMVSEVYKEVTREEFYGLPRVRNAGRK
ncbi:MAG TPA: hypothetical protein VFO67_11780 [Gemmatimonadales bacterium]|nr:hypothetical protein [Gemmatimonadales bacterium]